MKIRNFSIIAHIDHGKSTLADRILETTGAVSLREMKDRFMDTLDLEQEKGITIKLQTARMNWRYSGEDEAFDEKEFILNLIDTPGHVDFSYEVSRSIAASSGVVLLVDATQGIQAQTISNFYKALEQDLNIIPVITKIDLPQADRQATMNAFTEVLGFSEDEILFVSGKTGEGVEDLLNAIVERIPDPKPVSKAEGTKILIFDSFFHEHKGVVALVKVDTGEIRKDDDLFAIQTETKITPIEIGYLRPTLEKQDALAEGEVGYIATGLKDIKKVHVGDTITLLSDKDKGRVQPLPGYEPPKPMVFASLYPTDPGEFTQFSESLERLSLNDSALTYTKETSPILGLGYVCGFLGLLHLEIIQERLSREFESEVFSTMPSVLYRLKLYTTDEEKLDAQLTQWDEDGHLLVRTASEYPRQELVDEAFEPWVNLEIITPLKYMGPIIDLVKGSRGEYKTTEYVSSKSDNLNIGNYVILHFNIPTAEIVINFFDKLKSISQGYASMDYTHNAYKPADIVKVSILVNNDQVEALSFICHKSSAYDRGKRIVEKLSEVIPRQQFQIPIQAAIAGKIIARADVRAFRKNVTEKLYGGDVTRKKKLLEKQKKGKKRMKQFGSVEIPKEAFLEVLKVD